MPQEEEDLETEVREIVWWWDPIGIQADRALAPDEYEDVVRAALRALRSRDVDAVREALRRAMNDDYGLPFTSEDDERVVGRLTSLL